MPRRAGSRSREAVRAEDFDSAFRAAALLREGLNSVKFFYDCFSTDLSGFFSKWKLAPFWSEIERPLPTDLLPTIGTGQREFT